MHKENINKNFFKGGEITKNLTLLLKILQNYPKVREIFMNDQSFNPKNIDGRSKQAESFYGPYISNSPLETISGQYKNAFKQPINDAPLKSYIIRLNNNIELLTDVVNI